MVTNPIELAEDLVNLQEKDVEYFISTLFLEYGIEEILIDKNGIKIKHRCNT